MARKDIVINPDSMPNSWNKTITLVGGAVTAVAAGADSFPAGGVTRVLFSYAEVGHTVRVAFGFGSDPGNPPIVGTASVDTAEHFLHMLDGGEFDVSKGKDKGFDKITHMNIISSGATALSVQCFG